MIVRNPRPPRIAVLLAALALAAGALLAAPAVAAAAKIVVTDATIRLGDLFQVQDARADTPVARAPAPGRHLTLDRRWLARLARAHRVAWRPTGRGGITVERAGTPVPRDRLTSALTEALENRTGTSGEVDIFNRNLRLFVPTGKAPSVQVEDIALDRRSQRFTARITLPGDGEAVTRLRLTGLYAAVARVPVPRRDIAAGEVISARDLAWITVRESRIKDNLIAARDGLVGQSPRRRLRAGQMVRADQVGPPILVRPKSAVTMEISNPYMSLTAQGVALDKGSAGDVVRIRNLQSGKTVHAVVTGPDRVTVRPVQHLAAHTPQDSGASQ